MAGPVPIIIANCAPASVAPNVLAIVFAVSIAEVVSSMFSTNFSSSSPLLPYFLLSASISTEVVLSTIASSVEQNADTPRVRITIITKYIILAY